MSGMPLVIRFEYSSSLGGARHQRLEIVAQQRLTAGEVDLHHAQLAGLVQHAQPVGGRRARGDPAPGWGSSSRRSAAGSDTSARRRARTDAGSRVHQAALVQRGQELEHVGERRAELGGDVARRAPVAQPAGSRPPTGSGPGRARGRAGASRRSDRSVRRRALRASCGRQSAEITAGAAVIRAPLPCGRRPSAPSRAGATGSRSCAPARPRSAPAARRCERARARTRSPARSRAGPA